jgi:hypothetical protein
MGWIDMAGRNGASKKPANNNFSFVILRQSRHSPQKRIW